MSGSLHLNVAIIDDTFDVGVCHIAEQVDVKNALLQGGILGSTKGEPIKGLSMILSVSREAAHFVAVREGDFIAEGAIVCRSPCYALDTFRELLGHDGDDGWFGELARRNQIVSVLEGLAPPFGLIVWKGRASDRLSGDEFETLRRELQRIASGLAFELLNEEGS